MSAAWRAVLASLLLLALPAAHGRAPTPPRYIIYLHGKIIEDLGRRPTDPAYGVYAAADGLIAVAALEPHFRARFYAALGLPLDAPLHDVMRARTCDDWDTFARMHDVPLSRVR